MNKYEIFDACQTFSTHAPLFSMLIYPFISTTKIIPEHTEFKANPITTLFDLNCSCLILTQMEFQLGLQMFSFSPCVWNTSQIIHQIFSMVFIACRRGAQLLGFP